MSEMIDDTMDTLDEGEEELDDEAEAEIDKVLFEITNGKLGEIGGKVGSIPVSRAFIINCCHCGSADRVMIMYRPRRKQTKKTKNRKLCVVSWMPC
jgi:hypothetical protein